MVLGLEAFLHRALRAACLIAVVASIAACNPKIGSFEASPRQLCPGQHTTLAWTVEGNAVLSAKPPLTGTGQVDPTGALVFAPGETTTFTMTATRQGKEVFASQEVVVLATREAREIVIEAQPDGTGSLVAIQTLQPAVWDDLVRITTISGRSQRPLRILHEGRDVTLVADASASDQLRGTKVSGHWEIHAGLLPGEIMGDPAHAPPDRLRVLVHFSCGD